MQEKKRFTWNDRIKTAQNLNAFGVAEVNEVHLYSFDQND